MKRLPALLAMDLRFQFRQGIHPVYAGLTAAMALMLVLLPAEGRRIALPLLLFGEPSMLGMFFVGGLLFFEQDQGILQPLFAAPVSISGYLTSKVLSLGVIAVGMNALFLALFSPPTLRWLPALACTLLTSAMFTLIGIALSSAVKGVMTYMMLSGLIDVPAALPLLRHFGLVRSPLFRLIPTDGTLRLAAAAADPAGVPLSAADTAIALGVLLLAVVLLSFPAGAGLRSFTVYGKRGMR